MWPTQAQFPGYEEVNEKAGALGRYQMTPVALQATGMTDANGSWTGKYGVHSRAEFLTNPETQENALSDFLNDTEHQLKANGSFNFIGTSTGSAQVSPSPVQD